jgi:HSP20 family molecular chaperone IbpA
MVLNTSSSSPVQDASAPSAGTTGAANPPPFQGGAFGKPLPSILTTKLTPSATEGPFPPFGFFGRGGGGRGGFGGAFRGGMGHGRFRPETVSLEGGESNFRGPPPFWGPHPDPPLAPMPPVGPGASSFGPGYDGSGLAGLFGQHARNFAGDLAAHFGGQPTDGPMPEGPPGFGPHGRDFGGWHGRRGGRGGGGGGGGRGRGGWRGGWGHHHHHHHGEFVHPRMDIIHSDNTYTVTIELPGLQKQNVDISATEGLLTIAGEFPSSNPPAEDPFDTEYDTMDDEGEDAPTEPVGNPNNEGNGRYLLHERPTGKFKRSLRLPGWVNLDSIKATMTEGVLTIVVEKPPLEGPPSTTRKVSIA